MSTQDLRVITELPTDSDTERAWKFEPRFHFGELSGEWDDEPDKVQWIDADTGLDCIVKRNHQGVWCGYVGVPQGHDWYGKPFGQIDADVHGGGLTFSGLCSPGEPIDGICHIPFANAGDEKPWWIGFDCGHMFDTNPSFEWFRMKNPDLLRMPEPDHIVPDYMQSKYRTVNYARRECAGLADQVAAAS